MAAGVPLPHPLFTAQGQQDKCAFQSPKAQKPWQVKDHTVSILLPREGRKGLKWQLLLNLFWRKEITNEPSLSQKVLELMSMQTKALFHRPHHLPSQPPGQLFSQRPDCTASSCPPGSHAHSQLELLSAFSCLNLSARSSHNPTSFP